MSVTVEWYNEEETAFYVRYHPGWIWDEHHAAVAKIQKLREERNLAKSYCIFDMSSTTIPIGSPVGPHYTEPPQGSFIAMVVDNMFARTIVQIAIRALRKHHLFRIVSSRAEGELALESHIEASADVA